jgi:hypothetical protein
MNESDFAYWLQGFFELSNAKELSERQCKMIKDHLTLVFEKKTPDRWTYTPPAFSPYNDRTVPIYIPPFEAPLTWEVTCANGGKTYVDNYHIDGRIKTHLTC